MIVTRSFYFDGSRWVPRKPRELGELALWTSDRVDDPPAVVTDSDGQLWTRVLYTVGYDGTQNPATITRWPVTCAGSPRATFIRGEAWRHPHAKPIDAADPDYRIVEHR